MKAVKVEIIAPKKIEGVKAREIGTKKRPLPIWVGTKFPKAMHKMTKMKRLIGSRWDAILINNSYCAIKYIK